VGESENSKVERRDVRRGEYETRGREERVWIEGLGGRSLQNQQKDYNQETKRKAEKNLINVVYRPGRSRPLKRKKALVGGKERWVISVRKGRGTITRIGKAW